MGVYVYAFIRYTLVSMDVYTYKCKYMYACMYYVSLYKCRYVWVLEHIHEFICMYIWTCVFIHICMNEDIHMLHACTCFYVARYARMSIYTRVYVCMYMCMLVCMSVARHAWVYACTFAVNMYEYMKTGMHECLCIDVCIHDCMWTDKHECLSACLYQFSTQLSSLGGMNFLKSNTFIKE